MELNHVNIRTKDLEAMRGFLESITGLKPGERPDFPFPGYWLYDDNKAVVHLIEWQGDALDVGPVDHIAFGPFDLEATCADLEAKGFDYRLADVPGLPLKQIFVEGPEGVTLELQCPTA